MHDLYVALAVIGSLLLVMGLFTGLINNTAHASEPLIALLAGILVGPAALGWLNLSALVHLQDRFRVVSYSSNHETSDLRTYTLK